MVTKLNIRREKVACSRSGDVFLKVTDYCY